MYNSSMITRISLLVLIGSAIFFSGFKFGNFRNNTDNQNPTIISESQHIGQKLVTPTINMPLSYFSKDNFRGGSVGTSSKYDDEYTWDTAYVDVGYQTFPTITLRLKSTDYSIETKELPSTRSREEILSLSDIFKDSFTDQLNKYGNWAQRFLPEQTIQNIKKFDIDGDGTEETVIALCHGGNHCPDSAMVVKDNKIIFSSTNAVSMPDIIPAETKNGFYFTWTPQSTTDDIWDEGLCCSLGHIKTRFVFGSGKLVPVYEEEVRYLKVKNI